MRQTTKILLMLGVATLFAAACYQDDIDGLQEQINALKSGEIATVNAQVGAINNSINELKAMDSSLKEYITALQEDGDKYASQISNLTKMDKELEEKIDELQKYVDSQLKKSIDAAVTDTKEWVNATFATLDQLEELCGTVAGIPAKIDAVSKSLDTARQELTEGYTKAVNDAVSSLESSMKKWVNEQLADYYTIAQVDAMLDSLSKANEEADAGLKKQIDEQGQSLAKQIEEQKQALEAARSEITAAYKKAIADAIGNLEGRINSKIATEIAKAKNALQVQITAVNNEISGIKTRLDVIEKEIEALKNRIQSIAVIPEYTDGEVRIVVGEIDTLSFYISPVSAAESLAAAWKDAGAEERKSLISFDLKEVKAKADEPAAPSAAVDTVFFEDGMLKIKVRFANLPDESMASLRISYGGSDISSKYFGLYQVRNLGADGTANCYIVSKAGEYIFKAVKGNSDEPVGDIKGVKVLWETFGTATVPAVGELIKADVSYFDDFISFSTNDTFKEGNAVIAAYSDADCTDGKVLWSWHIWLTDRPEDQIYNNNAGTMMDRNLGATCTTPGDVGALGLLYQWGRKDPFLGGCQISYSLFSNQQRAASTLSWPSPVSSDSSNGTIAYAVSHPTTFIMYNSNNWDWYYTGSSSTDNTRWNSSKGTYDPCPPGYRVPDGGSNGVWAKAFGTGSYWTTSSNWDSTNRGMDFGKTDKALGSGTIWYPSSGYLYFGDGSLGDVGSKGDYWSCTPFNYGAYLLFFYYNGRVSPPDSNSRAGGQSVRCLSE